MLSRNLVRISKSLRVSSARATRVLPRLAALNQPKTTTATRSISTSHQRSAISALSTKLAEEIKYEETEATDVDEPEFLKDFKAEGVWDIIDTPGADEVILTRSHGNEHIRILFSISDIDADMDDPADLEDFASTPNEEGADAGSGGVGDEHDVAAEGDDANLDESFPVEACITVTKEGVEGALSIDATAQDGLFTINNICYYPDAKLANGSSAEDDWKRSGLYMGPDFDNLDENVQMEFETFLEDRGINSNLALFVPDLCEHKEQKEYLSWLKNVKNFIEA